MSKLTTHVLNIAIGKPASGITIVLEAFESGAWKKLATGITNADGRVTDFPDVVSGENNKYRLNFHSEDYFNSMMEKTFYPIVSIEFYVIENTHYHVPLLISPYGYSTYRGS